MTVSRFASALSLGFLQFLFAAALRVVSVDFASVSAWACAFAASAASSSCANARRLADAELAEHVAQPDLASQRVSLGCFAGPSPQL